MKPLMLIAILFSTSSLSHGSHNCCPSDRFLSRAARALGLAPVVVSIFWNGGEIINHGLGALGYGESHEHNHDHESCEHKNNSDMKLSNYWHLAELGIHTGNLVFSGRNLFDATRHSKKMAFLLLGLNMMGAFAQIQTAYNRGKSWTGILMSPFSSLDFMGHLSDVWISAKELF